MDNAPVNFLPQPADELFAELAKKSEVIMDGPGWSVVKTSPTTVGPCTLKKKKSSEAGTPELIAGAACVLKGITVEEFLKTVVIGMPTGCPKWDKTCVAVNTIQQITDTDMIYQYIYDPGRAFFLLSKRDMVYYEGWRVNEKTGVLLNVGASLPSIEKAVPLGKDTVRSHLLLHMKRATPVVEDGKVTGVLYETFQHVDMAGHLPNAFAFDGMLDSLVVEISGFFPNKK